MKSRRRFNRCEPRDGHAVMFIKRRSGLIVEVLIDAGDVPLVMGHVHPWYVNVRPGTRFVYVRSVDVDKRGVYLHRFLMGEPDGLEVDHINLNTLDNRRSNLRAVDKATNMLNRFGPNRNSSSGHIGVRLRKDTGKWTAYAGLEGRNMTLGSFVTIEEAIAARKQWDLLQRRKAREEAA